jgi:hypothetical protein
MKKKKRKRKKKRKKRRMRMNKYEEEIQEKGKLPSHSFPGAYPIYYVNQQFSRLCSDCAKESPEDIRYHEVYLEGPPTECDECGKVIESAYGDPEEEESSE